MIHRHFINTFLGDIGTLNTSHDMIKLMPKLKVRIPLVIKFLTQFFLCVLNFSLRMSQMQFFLQLAPQKTFWFMS